MHAPAASPCGELICGVLVIVWLYLLLEAIASRLEAIASRLEAIASRFRSEQLRKAWEILVVGNPGCLLSASFRLQHPNLVLSRFKLLAKVNVKA